MPILVLSPVVTSRLLKLQSQDDLPETIRDRLLLGRVVATQPDSSDDGLKKMDGSSPAVPPPLSQTPEQVRGETKKGEEEGKRLAISHEILVLLSEWTNTEGKNRGLDPGDWTLWSLVRGSEVFVEPKKVVERSAELTAQLLAIQRAQDEALYLNLTLSLPYKPTSVPPSFVSIAGIDPSAPLLNRLSMSHPTLSARSDTQAWKEVSSLLSVLVNVLLSMAAVSAAAWYGTTGLQIPFRVLLALMAALLTATAETVLYARYWDYVGKSRKVKSDRAKGSDVKDLRERVEAEAWRSDGGTQKEEPVSEGKVFSFKDTI